jgi:Rrf2 family transcriptional regulator, iron-sulfur cluster assembly transcription factor
MKITAQEEYGLRCLLRLASAPEGALTLPEIAEAEGLSVPHVAKLMAVLRHAGLLDSVRGRSGGYRLAKAPEEIRLGSLLLILGEPLFDEADYCHKHAGIAPDGVCLNHASCTLKSLWQTLEHWMRATLDRITIADLMQHEGRVVDLLRDRLAAALGEETSRVIPLTMVNS